MENARRLQNPRPVAAPPAQVDQDMVRHYRRRRLLSAMDTLAEDAIMDGFPNAASVLREAANQLRIAFAAERSSAELLDAFEAQLLRDRSSAP